MTTAAKSKGSPGRRASTGRLHAQPKPKLKSKPKPSRSNRRVKRRREEPRTRKQKALLVAKWGAIVGLVFTALGATTIAALFWHFGRDPNLPKLSSFDDYKPLQVSRIVTRDGHTVGELYTERRTYVPYEQIPDLVVNAFIAAEDGNFRRHKGIDYWGMFRAVIVNLKSRKKKQGASTITQQVVKTFLLSPERTFKRKFQEIILARRLEKKLSKDEILALYLNQIYFGHGRYGVQEAARYYFGKNVQQLNAGEAAMLGGLPQGPELLSPRKKRNHARAKRRQHYVLEQMAHHGFISEAEARKWINRPIEIVREPFPDMGGAPEWVDIVRKDLVSRYGKDNIASLGATVTTTLDLAVQRKATLALREGLRLVDARHKIGRVLRHVKVDKIPLEIAKLSRKLPKKGPKRGKAYRAIVVSIHDGARTRGEVVVDLGNWRASIVLGGRGDERYNPETKKPSERFKAGDLIRVVRVSGKQGDSNDRSPQPAHSKNLVRLQRGPEGAVVVIDPRTRKVLAAVGGYRVRVGDFNRAAMAKRQPGSSFKPFVYAAAVDAGRITPASIINDAPEVYNLWKPQNYKKGKFEGPVRARYALAKSINTVAIRLLHDVGAERVAELAHDMGVGSKLPKELSLALGSGEVTLLEMTNAFATFAAAGRAAPPRFITSINGKQTAPDTPTQVISPQVAYTIVDMMRSVVTEGTGRRLASVGVPVAGKTGTSNDARDAWFVGMTPRLVIGVWVGYDDNRPLGRREGGGRTAAPIVKLLLKKIARRRLGTRFRRPPGMVTMRIDKKTGLVAPKGAAKGSYYDEVFIEGAAPTEVAPAPGESTAGTFVVDSYEDEEPDDEKAATGSGGAPGSGTKR